VTNLPVDYSSVSLKKDRVEACAPALMQGRGKEGPRETGARSPRNPLGQWSCHLWILFSVNNLSVNFCSVPNFPTVPNFLQFQAHKSSICVHPLSNLSICTGFTPPKRARIALTWCHNLAHKTIRNLGSPSRWPHEIMLISRLSTPSGLPVASAPGRDTRFPGWMRIHWRELVS
jgi:hypothetical protein